MQILHFTLSFFVSFHKINKIVFNNIVDSLGFSFLPGQEGTQGILRPGVWFA